MSRYRAHCRCPLVEGWPTGARRGSGTLGSVALCPATGPLRLGDSQGKRHPRTHLLLFPGDTSLGGDSKSPVILPFRAQILGFPPPAPTPVGLLISGACRARSGRAQRTGFWTPVPTQKAAERPQSSHFASLGLAVWHLTISSIWTGHPIGRCKL